MRLTVGSATDVGQLRSLNEDSVLVATDLFAVADGMGGHRGGEVASARALAAFEASAGERTLEALMTAVQAANRDVFEHARTSPELTGMGTTLCAVAPLDDHRVAVVNVGDSRVYLHRAGALSQVSEDHSFVESLVRDGRLTRAQADVHPQRNVLTRALGIEQLIDVDGWEVPVRNGDRFLLCSDGLFNEVSDARIEELLTQLADPVEAAGRLVEEANAGGGRDNISCVVVDVSDVDESTAPVAADVDDVVGRPIDGGIVKRTTAADIDETSLDQPSLAAPTESAPAAAAETAAPRERRRVSWRTVAFLLAIVLVFAVALGSVDLYYRRNYSVVDRGGNVAINHGPAEKTLWITPRLFRTTDIVVADLDATDRARIRKGYEGLTKNAATYYVDHLRPATTTTTSTTTTTVPPTTTVVPDTSVVTTVVAPPVTG
ncbi:MAG: Stp1/IreP family PP2C-type Ser/Thr phosphatase [Acidimicrobiales bacterium]